MNGLTLGIDLGTTNSAVAARRLESEIILNDQGEALTPSCVYLKDSALGLSESNVVVGRDALNGRKQDPTSTITHVKRLVGRGIKDPNVQNMMADKLVGYQVKESEQGAADSLVVAIPSKNKPEKLFEFSPEEISSAILQKLKADAERELGQSATNAVVTVPAYFNDGQRHATLMAARLAGFENCYLLSEPSAAAIAFGIDQHSGRSLKTVVVFDFGGGTLDISVLSLGGKNIVEQGKAGDMWLGGKDIDQALSNYLLEKAEKENPLLELASLREKMSKEQVLRMTLELETLAEQAKIQLANRESTTVAVMGLFEEDGLPVDFSVDITRKELDLIVAPFVERSMRLLSNLLEELAMSPDCIDDVLLVGGSSQLNLVREELGKMFVPEKVQLHPRPMLSVVEGAAIYSQYKTGDGDADKGLGDILLTSAHDYFLHIPGKKDALPMQLTQKNMPLPMTKEIEIRLQSKKQRLLQINFLNLVNRVYESVGRLWLSINLSELEEDQLESSAQPPILVLKVSIDENNLISAGCHLKGFSSVAVQHSISRGKVDERLYLDLEKGISEANEIEDGYSKKDYQERAQSIVEDINQVLDKRTDAVRSDVQERVELKLRIGKQLLQRKEAIFYNIYYLEGLYDFCQDYAIEDMDESKRAVLKDLGRQLKLFKRANLEEPDVESLIQMRDNLCDSFHDNFPTAESLYQYGQMIGLGEDLGMDNEVEEMKDIFRNRRFDNVSQRRLSYLGDKIIERQNKQQYTINTDFTLA